MANRHQAKRERPWRGEKPLPTHPAACTHAPPRARLTRARSRCSQGRERGLRGRSRPPRPKTTTGQSSRGAGSGSPGRKPEAGRAGPARARRGAAPLGPRTPPGSPGPLTQADDGQLRPGARRPFRPRGRPLLHAGAGRLRAPPLAPRLPLQLGLRLPRRLGWRLCEAAVRARSTRGHIGRGVTGPAGARRRPPGRTPARRCPSAPGAPPRPATAPGPPASPCPTPCRAAHPGTAPPGRPALRPARPAGAAGGVSVGLWIRPPGPEPAPSPPRAWRPRRACHVTRPRSRSGAGRAGGGGWGGPGARAPPWVLDSSALAAWSSRSVPSGL